VTGPLKSLALLAVLAAASPAQAAILYSDDFDSYVPVTSALNFTGFAAPLTVAGGSVDVVKSGEYGISCVGGSGGCVDLDGTTLQGGTLSWTFSLSAGSYGFSFDISGNQRGLADDEALFEITADDPFQCLGCASFTSGTVFAGDPFFTAGPFDFQLFAATSVTITLRDLGGDNSGVIIDNVLLTGPDQVPEPASLALLGLGLAGLGYRRRRG
jgi:PEP-CTERM motif